MIPDCPKFVINGKFVDRANPQSISPDTHSLASVASELEPSKPPSVVLDAAQAGSKPRVRRQAGEQVEHISLRLLIQLPRWF